MAPRVTDREARTNGAKGDGPMRTSPAKTSLSRPLGRPEDRREARSPSAAAISDAEREPRGARIPQSLTLNLFCLADDLPFMGALVSGLRGRLDSIVSQ